MTENTDVAQEPRTIDDINKEYGATCALIGDLDFKIYSTIEKGNELVGGFNEQLKELRKKLFSLNAEANAITKPTIEVVK